MSTYRCEVERCRGNTPCASCLAALSTALVVALEDAFPDDKKDTKRRELTQKLRSLVFGCIEKRLTATWARCIVGKESPKEKVKA